MKDQIDNMAKRPLSVGFFNGYVYRFESSNDEDDYEERYGCILKNSKTGTMISGLGGDEESIMNFIQQEAQQYYMEHDVEAREFSKLKNKQYE